MNLNDVVVGVENKLDSEITDSSLIALALTGSRAGDYNHAKSDFDFFAIFESDTPFYYYEFNLMGNEISVKIEGRQRFEDKIKSNLHTFSEQGCFVWLPYIPFIGEQYINNIENEARSILLEDFIRSLPTNQNVKVVPERIAEWPLIYESLIWPSSISRLRAIVKSGNKTLKKVIPKYVKSLEEKGIYLSNDGAYIIKNTGDERKNELSFLKKTELQARRFIRKKENLTFGNYIAGGLFVLLQVPEKLCDLFYIFPQFERKGDYLEYIGPTLSEFSSSRKYLDPLRAQVKNLKEILLS